MRLLLGTAFAVVLPLASALGGALRASDNGRRLARGEECTILVAHLLAIPGESLVEETSFDCEVDPLDANGRKGMIYKIAAPDEDLEFLRKEFKVGSIVSGETKVKHGQGASIGGNKIHMPPGLLKKGLVKKKGRGRTSTSRRRLNVYDVFGDKPILVVKVTDSGGLARPENPQVISQDIFGPEEPNVNLKSQLFGCSFGKLNVVPGNIPNPEVNEKAPGVTEVTIGISLTNNDRYAIHNAVTAEVQEKLDITLPGPYEQVMYIVEKCYVGCGYAAYAYPFHWMSVYQNHYYKHVGVQVHELGHNFGFAHSGGLDGQPYTDHTGMMGNPLYSDDVGKMCWNAAKSWQVGWYNDRTVAIDPKTGPTTHKLVGVANYDVATDEEYVVIKIESGTDTDLFVAFNRATGVNSDNVQADDQVTVVETGENGEGFSQSYLKATLLQGQSHTIPNWAGTGQSLTITATDIDQDSPVWRATIHVSMGPPPPTNAPTGCPGGFPLLSLQITADSFPTETSFTLRDDCTNVVEKQEDRGFLTTQSQVYSMVHCATRANPVFEFIINDSYGDGICCGYGTGSYILSLPGYEDVEGGQFSFTESKFIGASSCDSSPPNTSPPVAPTSPPVAPTPPPVAPTPPPVAPTLPPVTPAPSSEGSPAPSSEGSPSPGVIAEYDAAIEAPRCSAVSRSSCSSGEDLLDGKDGNNELNPPNTLDDCDDGIYGSYHSDESVDSVAVKTLDGGAFQVGKTVEIEAKVWAWSSYGDKVDFFYSTTAVDPLWNLIGTSNVETGLNTVKAEYTLPAGNVQAVRVQVRFYGSAVACSGGYWDDVDDIVFALAEGAPSQNQQLPKSLPPLVDQATASCNVYDDIKRCEAANCKWHDGKEKGHRGCVEAN